MSTVAGGFAVSGYASTDDHGILLARHVVLLGTIVSVPVLAGIAVLPG